MASASCKYVSLVINCSCFSFVPLRDLLFMCEDTPVWCSISSHIPANCSQLATSLTQGQCSPHLGGGPGEEGCAGPGSGIGVPDSQKKWSRRREHEFWVATSTWTCGLLALWRAMQSSQTQALKAQISVQGPSSLVLRLLVIAENRVYIHLQTHFSLLELNCPSWQVSRMSCFILVFPIQHFLAEEIDRL